MKLQLGSSIFKFSVIPVMVFLCLLYILISLGFWQIGRAEEKSNMLEQQAQRNHENILLLTMDTADNPDLLRYRKVKMSGKYDQEHQFLIDNQVVAGKVGYFVLTPFVLDHDNKAVLVNRGWVALNKNRSILPDVNFTADALEITGRINNFPSVGLRLPDAEIPTEGWPAVVQVVDSVVLGKMLNYSLFQFQVQLDKEQADGYLREWKKTVRITPEKHIAYAIQWFGLAITLVILFLWFYAKQENNE